MLSLGQSTLSFLCVIVILNITIFCHELGHWICIYFLYNHSCIITFYPFFLSGNVIMLKTKENLQIRVKWYYNGWWDTWEPNSVVPTDWKGMIIYPAGPITGILTAGILHLILRQFVSIYPYVYLGICVSYWTNIINLLPISDSTDGNKFLECLGYRVPRYLHFIIITIGAIVSISLMSNLQKDIIVMFKNSST